MNTKNVCYFFTSTFPYGNGETFIENELPFLTSSFEEVLIFPLDSKGQARPLPANARVVNWKDQPAGKFRRQWMGLWISTFTNLIFRLVIGKLSWADARYILSLLRSHGKAAGQLRNFLRQENSAQPVFYSYWFDDWATVLGLLVKDATISGFHSRAHGFDVYEERRSMGFIPFRRFQLKMVSTVNFVSHAGCVYLSNRYPSYSEKFAVHRLGVVDHGAGFFDPQAPFTLVSCSNIVPVKRLYLVIHILSKISLNLRWIHFGTGKLENDLKKMAASLPGNIAVEFKGQISNADLMEYYKTHSVNLFINTSESEGIPVSIMEAVSFGIPVLATSAGGTPEIVNVRTGKLLPVNFLPETAAEWIENFAQSKENTIENRNSIRNWWKQHYEAGTNYLAYINSVLKSN